MKTITLTVIAAAVAFVALLQLPQNASAQEKTVTAAESKKTITIHVTKEINGDVMVIDTTIVTDGNFDADAFLKEKGISVETEGAKGNIQKEIIIRHPQGEAFTWTEGEGTDDTLVVKNKRIVVLDNQSEMPALEGMPFNFNFDMEKMPPLHPAMFEAMFEGMARSIGLGNVTPFGDMKKVVVKKKRNGKKVIITFEDRDEDDMVFDNRIEKKIIIIDNGEAKNAGEAGENVIIDPQSGEKVIIKRKVIKTDEGEKVIIDAETEGGATSKTETKVIVIEGEKAK